MASQKSVQELSQTPQIWAVASGKGGVGKSFVAANLAMALASHEKKAVVVDLDLGSANAHTCLGVNHPNTTLSDLLHQKNADINLLVERGENPFIGLISGASDDLNMANLKHYQKLKIIRNLKRLDADYVILDLGAGTGFNTLDFFLAADRSLLVVMPEPTSVENSYRFIRSLLTRQLKSLPKAHQRVAAEVFQQQKNKGVIQSFAAFLSDILEKYPEQGQLIQNNLKRLQVHLILNQIIDPSDIKLGEGMALISKRFFSLNLHLLGYLYHDNQVVQSLKQKQSYYQSFPQCRNSVCLHRIAEQIIAKRNQEQRLASASHV
jgi:flagellar biosynthesis protein FlhG